VTGEEDRRTNERLGHSDLLNWRRRVWWPACRAADVEATPYDLRHTYVSLRFSCKRLAASGAYRDRTGDPQLAKLVLSQLS
jgi:integrase